MIILDENTELNLAAAVANLPWTISYRLVSVTCGPVCNPCFENKSASGVSSAGNATILANPTASTNTVAYSHEIYNLSIHNNNAVVQTVTLQVDDGTGRTLFSYTLLPGENLVYESGNGWQVI